MKLTPPADLVHGLWAMKDINTNGSTKRSRFALVAAEGDPLKLVDLIPLGSSLFRQASNGTPYWFARVRGRRPIYVGSDEDKEILEQAWKIVAAQVRRFEERIGQSPDGQLLRQLQAMAAPSLARTAAEPPEPTPRLASGAREGRRPKR